MDTETHLQSPKEAGPTPDDERVSMRFSAPPSAQPSPSHDENLVSLAECGRLRATVLSTVKDDSTSHCRGSETSSKDAHVGASSTEASSSSDKHPHEGPTPPEPKKVKPSATTSNKATDDLINTLKRVLLSGDGSAGTETAVVHEAPEPADAFLQDHFPLFQTMNLSQRAALRNELRAHLQRTGVDPLIFSGLDAQKTCV